MTSLWRITTGADGNCNLLEIAFLRPFPDGELAGQSADTRIEALEGLWGEKPLLRVVYGKVFVLWKPYRKHLFYKFLIAIIDV